MRSPLHGTLGAALLGLALSSTGLTAQDVPASKDAQVELKVAAIKAVTEPIEVVVTIRNTGALMVIHEATVRLHQALVMTSYGTDQRREVYVLHPPSGAVSVPIQIAAGQTFSFPAVSLPRGGIFSDPLRCLTYRCGAYPVQARVVISREQADGPRSSLDAQIEIRPRANLPSIVVAGWAGVLCGALFIWLRKPVDQRYVMERWAGVRFVCYGIISITIALWLLETTTVAGFPISITVCDSLGGAVLGVFFVPVGDFLASRILPSPKEPAAPKKPATPTKPDADVQKVV